jgi:hypothetical protein
MARARPITFTDKKFAAARRVAVLCDRVAKRNADSRQLDMIAAYIVAKLPQPFMRDLVRGKWKHPHWEAMKLTLPFFAR